MLWTAADRIVTQQELRNDSAAVLGEVETGRTLIVSRNDGIDPALLPEESAISTIMLAELAAGSRATEDENALGLEIVASDQHSF